MKMMSTGNGSDIKLDVASHLLISRKATTILEITALKGPRL